MAGRHTGGGGQVNGAGTFGMAGPLGSSRGSTLGRWALETKGIQTGLHYPVPLHLQEAYASLGHGVGDYPSSERVASSGLSLPLYPHMTEAQVTQVAAAVEEEVGGLP